jgi:hypothetical protein
MDSLIVNGYGQFRNHFNSSEAFAAVKQTYVISNTVNKIKLRAIHAGFEMAVKVFRLDGHSIFVVATGE